MTIFIHKINQMNRILPFSLLLTLLLSSFSSFSQKDYDPWFTGEQLRYDFLLAGNQKEMMVYPMQMSREPLWAGSKLNLADASALGTYRFVVADLASGKVLFTRGFCTLFQEWQSTAEARSVDKAYYHAVFFPFPKQKIKLTFEYRNYDGDFLPVFTTEIDPANYFILGNKAATPEVAATPAGPAATGTNTPAAGSATPASGTNTPAAGSVTPASGSVTPAMAPASQPLVPAAETPSLVASPFPERQELLHHGDPATHVDLLFLSEGYTSGEKEKFLADARRMSDCIFAVEPYTTEKEKFNVNTVFVPSQESGTDVPGEHIYRNTAFNSTFYTFDVDRYLTTSDMRSIYDAASGVAWDHIIILVNTKRYGGGGFYNFLTVCTTDHPLTPKVLVHELGHGLAGLGDEYYNSEVAYENYYNLAVEPWEPNITTMVDFGSKWKHRVNASTPVPTPREPQYAGVVGAFEGGGYMSKGIFSPMQDCLMKSNNLHTFCPVCQDAIRKAIDFLAGDQE